MYYFKGMFTLSFGSELEMITALKNVLTVFRTFCFLIFNFNCYQ